MSSWHDFNDAQQNPNLIPRGTLAKVRVTIRPGGYDEPSQGWTGGFATRGSSGAVYLSGEFTVTEGPYARRKIFSPRHASCDLLREGSGSGGVEGLQSGRRALR
jgi:hypothetical protein